MLKDDILTFETIQPLYEFDKGDDLISDDDIKPEL
jgi:hypothetical protein